jgi:hypothetical protein
MKTKIITLLLALTATVRANLIDLTPGGYDPLNPPPVVVLWQQQINQTIFGIAYAQINNVGYWYPGYLQPPFVSINVMGQPTATLAWNLTGGPFSVAWIGLNGPSGLSNLYHVTSPEQIVELSALVTIDEETPITTLALFGPVPIPRTTDTGTTLGIFALGLITLAGVRRYRRAR